MIFPPSGSDLGRGADFGGPASIRIASGPPESPRRPNSEPEKTKHERPVFGPECGMQADDCRARTRSTAYKCQLGPTPGQIWPRSGRDRPKPQSGRALARIVPISTEIAKTSQIRATSDRRRPNLVGIGQPWAELGPSLTRICVTSAHSAKRVPKVAIAGNSATKFTTTSTERSPNNSKLSHMPTQPQRQP